MQKYAKTASRLADWLEKNIPEGLTVFSFLADHRRRLRTTNGLERVNKEVYRRTQVVSIFPNKAACLRLISTVLMEIEEEWQTGKTYLAMPNSYSSLIIRLGLLANPTEKRLHYPLSRLEEFGNQLRRPIADYLDEDIYELRTKTPSGQIRLLYFFFYQEKIISHGIRKKDMVPRGQIARAVANKKDYFERHERKMDPKIQKKQSAGQKQVRRR